MENETIPWESLTEDQVKHIDFWDEHYFKRPGKTKSLWDLGTRSLWDLFQRDEQESVLESSRLYYELHNKESE